MGKNKTITFNKNPLNTIQKRSQDLDPQDVLVILGSHYFGPHINAIYKNQDIHWDNYEKAYHMCAIDLDKFYLRFRSKKSLEK